MQKYSTLKSCVIQCGGVLGAATLTYALAVLMPSIIVQNTTSATAIAMNNTPLRWMPSVVEQVSVTAGAEAYVAAKSTGWIGWSGKTFFASTSIGYIFGSNVTKFVINGAEKVYEKTSSWSNKISDKSNTLEK